MSSPHSEVYESHTRKRVGKACDRCRLKKSKCDGTSPCSRCKADNSICVFGERRKSQDKIYPRGYIEMVEQQRHQLVACVREMYDLLLNNKSWPGQPLEQYDGHPLTHDILQRIGVLHMTGDNPLGSEDFAENLEEQRRNLLKKNRAASSQPRRFSSEVSDRSHPHSPASIQSSSVSSLSTKRSLPSTPPEEDFPNIVHPSKHFKPSMTPISQQAQIPVEQFFMNSPDTLSPFPITNDLPYFYPIAQDTLAMPTFNPMATGIPSSAVPWEHEFSSFCNTGYKQVFK